MRKIVIILITFLFITTESIINGVETDEIIDLASFALEKEMPMESWHVTFKETFDRDEIKDRTEKFKNSSLVTITENDNVIKYLLRDVHKELEFDVTYSVILPKDQALKAEIIVAIEGSNWDENIEQDYLSIKRSIKETYFTQSVQLFAWLTIGSSGIMDSGGFVEEVKSYFNLQHISTQHDTNQNSKHKKLIYGYTDIWKQKFIIEDTPMNLQIAVTINDEMNLQYTIGTPILIHEY